MSILQLHKLFRYKGRIYVPLLAQCRPLVGDIVLNKHNQLELVITREEDIIDKEVNAHVSLHGGTLLREHAVTSLDLTYPVGNQLLAQVIRALDGESATADLVKQLRVIREEFA